MKEPYRLIYLYIYISLSLYITPSLCNGSSSQTASFIPQKQGRAASSSKSGACQPTIIRKTAGWPVGQSLRLSCCSPLMRFHTFTFNQICLSIRVHHHRLEPAKLGVESAGKCRSSRVLKTDENWIRFSIRDLSNNMGVEAFCLVFTACE